MKGIVSKTYVVLFVICFLISVYTLLNFRIDISQRQEKGGYEVLENYEYHRYDNVSAPLGVREEYLFRFDEIDGAYRDLMFFTVHQNVDVYIGQNRVYRMRPYVNNDFGETPGCVWNRVALEDNEAGRTVRVVVYPVYKSSIGVAPKFYFGEEYDIAMDILLLQLPVLALCLICILLGILFAAYAISSYKNSDADTGLVMLGCFAVVISVWKLGDSEAVYLLFPDRQAIFMISYFALHLASAPFVLYVRGLNSGNRNSKIWYVPVWTSMGGLVVSLLLQLMRIADMRQMLWVIHMELIISVVVIFFMLFREVRARGMSPRLKTNLIFLLLCAVGLGIDMVVYFVSRGMMGTVAGLFCFVVYIFVLGSHSMKDARALIDFGLQAKKFEQKAYHDQLTGLNNRTAYADFIGSETFSPDHCIVAVFDLNNLKKCNDTLGHEKGDLYIKECASIIRETFSDIGTCYRMGGDEFCAILERTSLDVCKKRMKLLAEAVEERNRKNPEIDMGIAGGYEMFDKRIDYDINDTSRRADKMMYREKYAMKQAKEQKAAENA